MNYRSMMNDWANMGMPNRSSYGTHSPRFPERDEDSKPRYIASVWMDGAKASAVKFACNGNSIAPLIDWQSHTKTMDFSLSKVIEQWHSETELTKVLAPTRPSTEDKDHPLKRLIKSAQVAIVPITDIFEGLAAYQESTEASQVDWSQCKLKGRIEELVRRADNGPSPLLMAFLQGILHRDKSEGGDLCHTFGSPYSSTLLDDYLI